MEKKDSSSEYITHTPQETQEIARQVAKRSVLSQGRTLPKALVLALYGDLGSGKTTFVQGLAGELGISQRITSPTFVIVRSYELKLKTQNANLKSTSQNLKLFYHIDLYRVDSQHDLEGLGVREILSDPNNIVAIEWPEKLGTWLPQKRTDIQFEHFSDENTRKIIFLTSK